MGAIRKRCSEQFCNRRYFDLENWLKALLDQDPTCQSSDLWHFPHATGANVKPIFAPKGIKAVGSAQSLLSVLSGSTGIPANASSGTLSVLVSDEDDAM